MAHKIDVIEEMLGKPGHAPHMQWQLVSFADELTKVITR